MFFAVVGVVMLVLIIRLIGIIRLLRRSLVSLRTLRIGVVKDLIQFTFIQPDATAVRTVIYFYIMPFSYEECFVTIGTFHWKTLWAQFTERLDTKPLNTVKISL